MQVIYIIYENYSVASPILLVIFSATVYQEVTILFSLTRWMEMVALFACFMQYSSFAHKLNSNFWMETASYTAILWWQTLLGHFKTTITTCSTCCVTRSVHWLVMFCRPIAQSHITFLMRMEEFTLRLYQGLSLGCSRFILTLLNPKC